MRRFLAFFLLWAILIPCAAVTIHAVETNVLEKDDRPSNLLNDQMVSVFCRYDTEDERILIGGTIRHDILVKHENDMIEVFCLMPGETIEDILADESRSPVATSTMAVRFEFSIVPNGIVEKYARYCVTIRSADSEEVLITEPKYAIVESEFTYDAESRSDYKGIVTDSVSLAAEGAAGRVILPVYFDKITGTAADGLSFRYQGENVYFSESYIRTLDDGIRTASISGANVYLQFLMSALDEDDEEQFVLPDVSDGRVMFWVEALTVFLGRRYHSPQSGSFGGIVLGKEIDENLEGDLSAYAEKYALYALIVGNTARGLNARVDIAFPFSDRWDAFDAEQTEKKNATSLLESILDLLEDGLSEPYACTVLIESDALPLLPVRGEDGTVSYAENLENGVGHAANLARYDTYLQRLRNRYESAPMAFTFVWNVSDSISSVDLDTLYAYSYFKAFNTRSLASFAVSFFDRERSGDMDAFSSLAHLFSHIDTDHGGEKTVAIKNRLGLNHWQELCEKKPPTRELYESRALLDLPSEVRGEFFYMDFSTAFHMNGWQQGYGCKALRLSYGATGEKALQMELVTENGASAEMFWTYEYAENLVYTPYIALNMFLESKAQNGLYEVTVTVGQGRDRHVTRATLRANEETCLVMNVEDYSQEHMAAYWRISVRALDGNTEEASLWLSDIVGYSTELDSEHLSDKIMEERARIRNLSDADDSNDGGGLWSFVAIGVLILVIGIGVFVCVRPSEDSKEHREDA